MSLQPPDTNRFPLTNFRLRPLTTVKMASSSERSPPPLRPLDPFSASEEPGAGPLDMGDGDSDEGEDIFVNNVRLKL